MPGTYRYSATFDRTYLEETPPSSSAHVVVQSWETSQSAPPTSPPNGQPHNGSGHHARTGSVESLDSSGGSAGTGHSRQVSGDSADFIPTRKIGQSSTKPAHNPLQFVKIGQCPLYKQAAEQIKLAKEVKISKEMLREDEEEWQSNLDCWKSKRRQKSEKCIQRAEERRQIEADEQSIVQQRKTKTFSQMMEQRANRPRSYNLSIYTDQSDDQDGDVLVMKEECFSDSSNSGIQSSNEREEMDVELTEGEKVQGSGTRNGAGIDRSYGLRFADPLLDPRYRAESSASASEDGRLDCERIEEEKGASGFHGNVDSGLESLNSSQRAGDVLDSASDFSQDSGSAMERMTADDESGAPSVVGDMTVGTEMLEEFSSRKSSFSRSLSASSLPEPEDGIELTLKLRLRSSMECRDFGFTLKGGKEQGSSVFVDSVIPHGVGDLAGLRPGDEILGVNGEASAGRSHTALLFAVKQAMYTGQMELDIWRPAHKGMKTLNSKIELCDFPPGIELCHPEADHSEDSISVDMPDNDRTGPDLIQQQLDVESFRDGSRVNNIEICSDISPTSASNAEPHELPSFPEPKEGVESERSRSAEPRVVPGKKPPPVPVKPKSLKLKPRPRGNASGHHQNSVSTDNLVHSPDLTPVASELVNTQRQSVPEPFPEFPSSSDQAGVQVPEGARRRGSFDSQEMRLRKAVESPDVAEIKSSPVSEDGQLGRCTSGQKVVSAHPSWPSDKERQTEGFQSSDLSPNTGLYIIYDSRKDGTIHSHPHHETSTTSGSVGDKSPDLTKDVAPVLLESTPDDVNIALETGEVGSPPEDAHTPVPTENNPTDLVPAETVAEQMEQMILEQLEREETDWGNGASEPEGSDQLPPNGGLSMPFELAHLDTPPRCVEPPKEKPPPPPEEVDSSDQKSKNFARLHSTKHIKKELWRRRSDFLGLDSQDAAFDVEDSSGKLSMSTGDISKLNETGQQLNSPSVREPSRSLRQDEDEEIARKEREIIENLEREERERHEQEIEKEEQELIIGEQDPASEAEEDERIIRLKEERRRMEEERYLREEQRIRMEEERQLREREEMIRQQEDSRLANPSARRPPLSVTFRLDGDPLSEALADSVSPSLGDTNELTHATNRMAAKPEALKGILRTENKEALQREREKLRQEQEALQREKESYMQQLQKKRQEEHWEIHQSDCPSPDSEQNPPKSTARSDLQATPLLAQHPSESLAPQHHASSAISAPIRVSNPKDREALDKDDTNRSNQSMQGDVHVSGKEPFLAENTAVTNVQPQRNERVGRAAPGAVPTQPLARQSLHSLGVTPKAKIIQNEQWIKQNSKMPITKRRSDSTLREGRYNQNHWLVQEAEMRRIAEQKERERRQASPDKKSTLQGRWSVPGHAPQETSDAVGMPELSGLGRRAQPGVVGGPPVPPPKPARLAQRTTSFDVSWNNYSQSYPPTFQARTYGPPPVPSQGGSRFSGQPTYDTAQPSAGLRLQRDASEPQEQMLSVSGRKRCSDCGEELGRGAAMIIESLQLYYHIQCFCCCVCQVQLGNGSCGTDVRVRNSKLHCQNCYSNDEAGLKFSQV